MILKIWMRVDINEHNKNLARPGLSKTIEGVNDRRSKSTRVLIVLKVLET